MHAFARETQPRVPTNGLSFSGKVALITGATSGIGAATSLAFARHGASVIVVGRDEPRGRHVVEDCASAGGKALLFQADISRLDQARAMIDFALENFGKLDIAFNNAGYQEPRASLVSQLDEMYDHTFDTNVRSLFYAMRAEIAVMLRQGGGAIINNASVSGVRNPNTGLALYAATKAAVLSLTRSAAMEYAPSNIRINAVAPGRIVTPMMLASKIANMDEVAAGLPLRRMGQPEEVAAAVLWLASNAASFVVGHALSVDGGFLSA